MHNKCSKQSVLTEWSLNYIRNKDRSRKEIEDIQQSQIDFPDFCITHIKVRKNTVVDEYFLIDNLEYVNPEFFKDKDKLTIITLNTKQNLKSLLELWNVFIKLDIVVIFANPDYGEKWILRPKVHNLVSDQSTLKLGLESIFSGVPEYIPKD